ncbi:unnamed protein product [Haemonchus placei]|uniref:Origin recognition complex subunit 4 n=1 Tax=Haemonchus placei TaxID=6290 RepID=A0A0N4WRJ1_HAEPC|nr:unnamed protein product [Haemonchus placei]
MPKTMVSDLRESARKVLDDMKCFISGADEEKKALESIVSRFATSGEGNACVVVGRGESGRTTVVKNAVEEFELSAKLIVVSVAQIGSEKNTLQLLTDGEDLKSCILIIEDADELAARQRQSLLYLLLDTTRKGSDHQWLVFLMVQNQNFITSLEKRVRSRLSMARIVFQPASSLDEYIEAFGSFLGKENPEVSKEWRNFVMEVTADTAVLAELKYLFSTDNSYAVLKKVTSAFLCLYLANEDATPVSKLVTDAVEMILPRTHSLEAIVRSLSLWSLCVLLCVYRRLRSCPVSTAVGYRKIAQDFRRIGNTVDSRVRVPSDLAVYRELDRLVDYGLLIADSKANNVVFKRCSLNVHSKTLGELLRGVTLPMAIGYWFDTQTT